MELLIQTDKKYKTKFSFSFLKFIIFVELERKNILALILPIITHRQVLYNFLVTNPHVPCSTHSVQVFGRIHSCSGPRAFAIASKFPPTTASLDLNKPNNNKIFFEVFISEQFCQCVCFKFSLLLIYASKYTK